MRLRRNILFFSLILGFATAGFAQISESPGFSAYFDKAVQLYPNPATDFLTVKLQTPHASSVKLAMHTVIGNALTVEREQVDDYEVRLRVKDLPSGYYFLSIKEDETGLKATYKFLKR